MTQNPAILVTGGRGFIGAQMTKYLCRQNRTPWIVDNLSAGPPNIIPDGAKFFEGDIGDTQLISRLLSESGTDTVLHFAAIVSVEQSMRNPFAYYHNNFSKTLRLLDAMARHGVKYFIFSSTATLFGFPHYTPIDENHPVHPVSPYGRSKYLVEQILPALEKRSGIRFCALRYFNAAGADPEGDTGPRTVPHTHLVPLALDVALGRSDCLSIFGNDYDTKDGTCIRDYIHVADLCDAHWRALDYLRNGGSERFFNLGSGQGRSVLDVIHGVENITGKKIPVLHAPRRAGDPAILIADSRKAHSLLGWSPEHSSLETIITDALRWAART